MSAYMLLALVALSGFLAGFKPGSRFDLLKACALVGLETIVGSLLFLALAVVISGTFLKSIFIFGVGSIFSFVLLLAAVNGLVLYWLNRWLIPRFKISARVQTICEYIIQWTLIYITVYQVIFDNLRDSVQALGADGLAVANLDVTNPSDLVILLLPSLISVWISIILYKLREDSL